MRTTLELDDDLVKTAIDMGCEKTIRATVELALRELISARRRKQLIALIKDGDFSMTLEDLEEMRSLQDQHVPD